MKLLQSAILVCTAVAVMMPGLARADRGELTGFGDATFGMTREAVAAALDGRAKADGETLRMPADFEINGRRPDIVYAFDAKSRLDKVTIRNTMPAAFLGCFTSFQLYLHFVSAEHGKADYLFQDSFDAIRVWRAMFLFDGGSAVHLNVNFGTEDICSVEVGFLPAPHRTQTVSQ